MATSGATFEYKPGSIMKNLRRFDGDIDLLVAGITDYSGDKAVDAMRRQAPWADRTGNARATLAAYGVHGQGVHEIHLHGGMFYQLFLELRFAGRFAIIGPSVHLQGLAVMNRLRGLIKKLRALGGYE